MCGLMGVSGALEISALSAEVPGLKQAPEILIFIDEEKVGERMSELVERSEGTEGTHALRV